MNRISNKSLLKHKTWELADKGRRIGQRTLSILLTTVMLVSLMIPALRALPDEQFARAELLCSHIHEAVCYAVPEGHVCSEETGCEPVYRKADEETEETTGEETEETTVEEAEELTGEETEEAYGEETEEASGEKLDEKTGEDPELIGWICRVVPELVCEHSLCLPGDMCLVEQDDDITGFGGGMQLMRGAMPSMSGCTVEGVFSDEYGSLYEAFDAINSGPPGAYTVTVHGDEELTEPLEIGEGWDVTITSSSDQPFTLIQQSGERHFSVSGALTLENIILEGSGADKGTYYSGGVTMSGFGTLVMGADSVITRCYNYNGGGVFVQADGDGGMLIMAGGEITGNTANYDGGGVYVGDMPGPFYLTIEGGKINDNEARAEGGGAYLGDGSVFAMSGGEVSGNKSASDGGGLYMLGAGERIMSGGKISANTVINGVGGGVSLFNDSSFEITGGEISYNEAAIGGGIYTENLGLLIVRAGVIFAGNKADQATEREPANNTVYASNIKCTKWTIPFTQGYNNYDISQNGAPIEIARYIVTRDNDGAVIGGFHWLNNAVTACGNYAPNNYTYTITATTNDNDFTDLDDTAGKNGVPVYTGTSTSGNTSARVIIPAAKRITLTSNQSAAYTIKQKSFDRHFSVYGHLTLENIVLEGVGLKEGMVFNGGVEVRDTGNLFMNNGGVIRSCYNHEGGAVRLTSIMSTGYYSTSTGGKLTMSGGEISGNRGRLSGGVSVGSLCVFTMTGGVISDNTSDSVIGTGGGVGFTFASNATTGGLFTMHGGEISGNTSPDGGGVNVTSGTFLMTGGVISGNTSSAYGGGVSVTRTVTSSIVGNFTMSGGRIIDNSAGTYGGGVRIGISQMFTMINGEISGNNAKWGGGICLDPLAELVIKGGIITANIATNYGGGVYGSTNATNGPVFTLEGGKICNNQAIDSGGGVYMTRGAFKLKGGEISENTASIGGGVFLNNDFFGTGGIAYTMEGGKISGNTASQSGGGVFFKGSGTIHGVFVMLDGEIIGNSAPEGGGMFLHDLGKAVMRGGEISQNTASEDGGGVHVSSSCDFSMEGGKISGNKASGNGGGIFVNGTATITDAMIVGNNAGLGGGIYAYPLSSLKVDSSATPNQTVFAGNAAAQAREAAPSEQAVYDANVFTNKWTSPFVQGLNNYDIYSTGSAITSIVNVHFDKNHDDEFISGCSMDADPVNMAVFVGQSPGTLPLPPARELYFFEGWNTVADGSGTWFTASTVVNANLTVYAQWLDGDAFTVTFNSNHSDAGGWTNAVPAAVAIAGGDALGVRMPVPPTREGTFFLGWNTRPDGLGDGFTGATAVVGDITLYAQWAQNHIITFDNNHDDHPATGWTNAMPASVTVMDGLHIGLAIMPVEPTREGYAFSGWNTQSDGNGDAVTYLYVVENSLTVYAQWTPVCIVTFDKNHSDSTGWTPVTPAFLNAPEGEPLGRLPLSPPTRTGWVMSGWNTEPDGIGEPFAANTPVTEDITVYAQWREEFTVTFDKNHNDAGGTLPNPTSMTTYNGGSLGILPAPPTRAGWNHSGWLDGNGNVFDALTIVPQTMTVYAVWTPVESITVTFDKNHTDAAGMFTQANPLFVNIHMGGSLGMLMPKPPTRAGYAFTGWGTTQAGVSIVTATTPISASTTLYAQWTKAVTVRFDYAPRPNVKLGVYPYTSWRESDPVRIAYPSASMTIGAFPEPPFVRGEFFLGWKMGSGGNYKDPDVSVNTVISTLSMNKGEYVLYAAWDQANIIFYDKNHSDAGGWTDAIPNEAYVLKNALLKETDIPHTNPTREGYYFKGWSTNPNGGGSNKVAVGYKPPASGEHILYADWGIITYNIDYILGGGKNHQSNLQSYTARNSFPINFSAPTRPGYAFLGWTVQYANPAYQAITTPALSFSIADFTTGDVTLTAVWSAPINYTVSYVLAGGSSVPENPSSYNVELLPVGIKDTARAGYEFQGWTVEFSGDTPNITKPVRNYTIPKGAIGNVTLTANWGQEGYRIAYQLGGGVNAKGNPTGYTVLSSFPIQVNAPSRAGYDFAGWTAEYVNGSQADVTSPVLSYSVPTGTTGHIMLTAHWNIRSVTVTFNANAGADPNVIGPSPSDKVVFFDSLYGELAAISRAGYNFTGWYTSVTGGSLVSAGNLVRNGSNHTLYARWVVTTNNALTYDPNGGNGSGRTVANLTYGTTHIVMTTTAALVGTNPGYRFTGWNTAQNGSGAAYAPGAAYTVEGSETLYAQWEPGVSVTFRIVSLAPGGAYETEWDGVLAGGKAVKPADANPSGHGGYPANYEAVIWYTGYDPFTGVFSGVVWNFNDPVLDSMVLYAFDNVAWDSNSAVRSINHGVTLHTGYAPFADILVRSSFALEQPLSITAARNLKYHSLSGANMTITSGSGFRHFAISGGGAVNLEFPNSKVVLNGRADSGTGTDGGGIAISGAGTNVTLTNVTIQNCKAANGGAVSVGAGSLLNFSSGIFRDNYAANGGGVYNSGYFNMEFGKITGNEASTNGGGVYNSSIFIMTGLSEVSCNTAFEKGGGVYNSDQFTLKGLSLVSGNSAYERGGGVFNSGTFSMIEDAAIKGNNASIGGGVSNIGSQASFTMNGTAVSANMAYIGGGVENSGNFFIDGGTVSGNIATLGNGGGIYHDTAIQLDVKNSTITGNTAHGGNGGGIWIDYANLASLDVDAGTVFSGNAASADIIRLPGDNATYAAHIKSSSWSAMPPDNSPAQGYNNYDIAYTKIEVVFDKNHSDIAGWLGADPDSIVADYAQPLPAMPAAPTRMGRPFNGWNTEPDGSGTVFLASSVIIDNRSVTLYAQWAPAVKQPALCTAPNVSFGTGTIPMRTTLFGLAGGTAVSSSLYHVVNPNAASVTNIIFGVEYPLLSSWSLSLTCSPFSGPTIAGAKPEAFGRDGSHIANAFAGGESLVVYDSGDFASDCAALKASVDGDTGSWAWDRLRYDIKVEAQPGEQLSGSYQSVFTWDFVVGP